MKIAYMVNSDGIVVVTGVEYEEGNDSCDESSEPTTAVESTPSGRIVN